MSKKPENQTPSVWDNIFTGLVKFINKNKAYFILILIVTGIFLVLILNGFSFKTKKGTEIKIDGGLKEWQKK